MKKFLLLPSLLLSFSIANAQQYKEMIESGKYTIQEIKKEADAYFAVKGTGQGSGYKQYKRWEYNAERTADRNGLVRSQLETYKEIERFNAQTNHMFKDEAIKNGDWEELGPKKWIATTGYNPGIGRITSISVDSQDTNHIIIGSPTGGVWETKNQGTTWASLTDEFSNMRVYALAIAPSNSKIYYWGSSSGMFFKSTDSGATWTQSSPPNVGTINKILVHPTNPDTLWITTRSTGVLKSTNGGTSWQHVIGSGTFYDIEFKPGSTSIVYASGSRVFKSTNNGDTFTPIGNSTFNFGPKMMGVSPDNANVLYVLEASGSKFSALYKSTDSGTSFTKLNHANKNYFGYRVDASDSRGQAPRDMDIAVSPSNVNEVHIAGIIPFRSTDGGITFEATAKWTYNNPDYGYCHADIDIMEFIGTTLYVGSDGGIFIAKKTTGLINDKFFKDLTPGMGIHQFYRIGVSQTKPAVVTGGAQDNGSTVYQNGVWKSWMGADGMEGFVDNDDTDEIYCTSQNGGLYRSEDGGNSLDHDMTEPNGLGGQGRWVTPYEKDPTASNTIYVGYDKVYKSTDRGDNWTGISQDFNEGNGGVEHIKIAPSNNKIIYAVTDASKLYKTTTGGGTWQMVKNFGTGGWISINYLAVHPKDPQLLAIATNDNDKVMISDDGGLTWKSWKKNLPDFSALCVEWHDNKKNGLYVGMDYGIHYIDSTMNNWIPFNNKLPNVRVNELEINYKENKIYAATYGRGVWSSLVYGDTSNTSVPEPKELASGISVFPNPAKDVIQILSQDKTPADIRMYDNNGRLVHYDQKVILDNNYKIDVNTFSAGIYFIRVNNSRGTILKKVVIQ